MENNQKEPPMKKMSTKIRRESLIKAAQDSIYSGHSRDYNMLGNFNKQKKPTPSQGGTSYAPTDLDHREIEPDLSPKRTL